MNVRGLLCSYSSKECWDRLAHQTRMLWYGVLICVSRKIARSGLGEFRTERSAPP